MRRSQMTDPLTFAVYLPSEAHQLAAQSCQRWDKQFPLSRCHTRQAYLNTLSAYAVNFYLRCMEFETDWQAGDCQDPIAKAFLDVADVVVKHVGKLECRPVLAGEGVVRVPPDVWGDRVGYIAVQLDAELTEATLLGFLPKVASEEIPLTQWRSLDAFLQYASQWQQTTQLSRWFDRVFERGWEAVEMTFAQPRLAWRSSPKTRQSLLQTGAIERVKFLDFVDTKATIALIVRLKPKPNAEIGICLDVRPMDTETHLPQTLQLMVLNESGAAVMQAQTKGSQTMQFEFSSKLGERFSIRFVLGEDCLTESFLI
jgi:Protein of unknown function (DUF1822)